MIQECKPNTLLAHSDAYPTYQWRLHDQFDKNNSIYYTKLNNTHKLDIDYFQTTIMLYDTNIIQENTYDEILHLLLQYPISITNDQGIIALYFTNIRPLFQQIKTNNYETFFYDYMARNEKYKYIMLKSV
jgi:hypothetical protein